MTAPAPRLALPRVGTALVAGLVLLAQTTTAIGAIGASSTPIPAIASLILFTGATAWVVCATGNPLPLAPTMAATVVPTAAAIITDWPIVRFHVDAIWHLGASAFLLLLVALRGRLLAAWISMAGSAAATLVWSGISGFGVASTTGILVRQVAILVIGTLFIAAVGQLQRTLAAVDETTARLTALDAASAAAAEERLARLQWARSLSAPLLEAIAERDSLNGALRLQAALVEAELRDGLRAASLAAEPVSSAARRARERGVEVILLDDRATALSCAPAKALRSRVAQELDATTAGRFVARLPPEGRTPLATILVDGPEGRRLGIDPAELGGSGPSGAA